MLASLALHLALVAAVALFPFFHGKRLYKVPVTYTVSLVELPGAPARIAPPPATAPKTKEVAPPAAKVKRPVAPKVSEELAIPKRQAHVAPKEREVEPASPPPAIAPAEKVASLPPRTGGEKGLTVGPGATGTARVEGDFQFTYYLAIIENKISGNWVPPQLKLKSGHSEKATVSFKIMRSGQVKDIGLEAPSGVAFFDQSALRAVYRSLPLPPLPPRYKEESLLVHFSFELKGEEG